MRIATTGIVLLAGVGVWVGSLSAGARSPLELPQAFSSGSTGADGALDLATSCSSPFAADPSSCYVQLPPNGVLNYTTVNVPAGKVLKFRKNLQNTPVYLLAQGAITVAGQINVSAGDFVPPDLSSFDLSAPGPGGFRGGASQQPGFGPGAGGITAATKDGKWIGPLSLVPIIGGSGGGGVCGLGGGGGGAIVLASSTAINVTGSVFAHGNAVNHSSCGVGAGGAIRLVANSIAVAGNLLAVGGQLGSGVVRLEAPPGSVVFGGSSNPAAVISAINPTVFSSAVPALTIVSVGGYAVPTFAGQRFDTVDVILPMQLPDPISVVVAATNIPVGSQVHMSFGTGNTGTVTPGTLAGSTLSSSATVRVAGLSRTQLAYLWVHATFAVSQGADAGNPEGPNQIAQVQASAPPGGATQFAFLRKDGTRINERDVSPQLLASFRR